MLEQILVVSLICVGWHTITRKEYIFGFVHRNLMKLSTYNNFRYKNIAKPLGLCVTCSASFYGTIIYWTTILVQREVVWITDLLNWVLVMISVAFLNTLLWLALQYLRENVKVK